MIIIILLQEYQQFLIIFVSSFLFDINNHLKFVEVDQYNFNIDYEVIFIEINNFVFIVQYYL